MDERKLPWLTPAVFGVALVVLLLDGTGGPGWGAASAHVVLAARFEHVAASPFYDLIAGAFSAVLPAGEPGFRIGVLGALLGACTLAGIVAAVRALLPKDPVAGVVGASLVLVSPPFREAAAFASPSLLASAGLVAAVTLALRFASKGEARDAIGAVAACALVIGSVPWLGALLTIALVIWLARAGARRDHLALTIAALGVLIIVLWFGASGALPSLVPNLGGPLAAAGRGAAAIVLGAGLLGLAFGALTGLPRVRPIFVILVLALVHEALFGGGAAALAALCAIGVAILPSAAIRAIAPTLTGLPRHALALGIGLPLLGVAAATGATFSMDDPDSAPRELAHDLVDGLPPTGGIFVATRGTSWLAIHHEMIVAGMRPDLALVPPLPATQADAIVANALRANQVVGSDVASFGRLDVTRAMPRFRGYELVGEPPASPVAVPPPATYASAIGREQALLLALERGRYEGANGRLDAAARALGLEQRFGAADLAILGATVPSRERPALFGLIPRELIGVRVEPWLVDLFGDDLAWVAGVTVPPLPATAPAARKLHARWRAILSGAATPEDPEIAALGEIAVKATRELFKSDEAPAGSGAMGSAANGSAANGSAANGSAANGSAANGSATNGSATNGSAAN